VRNALERANKTLRGITGIEVLKENAAVENGKIAEFRAMVQVTFVLDD
jgi:flavin-binding protein dodecin